MRLLFGKLKTKNKKLLVMMRQLMVFLLCCGTLIASAQQPVDYVNPFIGTSNYGTTNPGAICPQGMMSVVPFNVMGSEKNRFDKDNQWWSTPYSADNKFLRDLPTAV